MENYNITLSLKATPAQVFNALTQQIPQWWTKAYQGAAAAPSDQFKIKFGENVAKTLEVVTVVEPFKVVWLVKEALIDIPQLTNKSEWVGTTISWTMDGNGDRTWLNLEHVGLHNAVECFDICTAGWLQFTESLKKFIETGQGNPY
ncbi:SRPBCC family protein [Pedobacter sp.]